MLWLHVLIRVIVFSLTLLSFNQCALLVIFAAFCLLQPISYSSTCMSSPKESQQWNSFGLVKISRCYHVQTVQPPLGLCPFFSSNMARLSAGCTSDGLSMQPFTQGFHPSWQRNAKTHQQMRNHGFHIVTDIVHF